MSKTVKLFGLAVLAAAGWGAYENWDRVETLMGEGELSPVELRCLERVQTAYSIEERRNNAAVIGIRARASEGGIDRWEVEVLEGGSHGLVTCHFTMGGRDKEWPFMVEIGGAEEVFDLFENPDLAGQYGLLLPPR